MNPRRAPLTFVLNLMIASLCACAGAQRTIDVCDYGAQGDGRTLDTAALNESIEACAAHGGGRVRFPAGQYLTGTIHLKSNVALLLDTGAEVIGTTDLNQYQSFTPPPGTLLPPEPGWHRALILGEGVENVTITGRGVICGNNVFDPEGEEHVRGPHAVLLGNCRNVKLTDISIRDAANYAVLLEFSSHVAVCGVKITGGYDGVHMRGWQDRPCRDVHITDCEFYTGDDCIAGWYWQQTRIERCVLNSSSNGLRLFGPAKDVRIQDCRIFGPGRSEWRTSGLLHHTNMAAGLCIQPSAWGPTPGEVDDVRISDVVMHDVGTPLHLAAKSPSTIGHVSIDRLSATGVYRAAASIESWGEQPIARVDVRDSTLQFVGGRGPFWNDPAEAVASFLSAEPSAAHVHAPGEYARPLPVWGLYARHVQRLDLLRVRLEVQNPDPRPAILFDGVENLHTDRFRYPDGAGPLKSHATHR